MTVTAADLFCGGGGATRALERVEGVKVAVAADIEQSAVDTYNRNCEATAIRADLETTSVEGLCEEYDDTEPEDIDLVVGCPPCQNFSSLRDTTPWPEDEPKDALLQLFVKRIREVSPSAVVFENVPGICKAGGTDYLKWFRDQLDEMGYGLAWGKLNAANYGVPQERKRTIVVGIAEVEDAAVSLPESTHSRPNTDGQEEKEDWVTVEDQIGDLPPLKAGETAEGVPFDDHYARNHRPDTVELLSNVPDDGGSRQELPDEFVLDCHKQIENHEAGNVYGRMSWSDPAPTLTTRCTNASSGRFVHPEQDRSITLREAARLMGFEDDYDLPDVHNEAETVIGNAVPPAFMYRIVRYVVEEHRETIDGSRREPAEV